MLSFSKLENDNNLDHIFCCEHAINLEINFFTLPLLLIKFQSQVLALSMCTQLSHPFTSKVTMVMTLDLLQILKHKRPLSRNALKYQSITFIT